MADGVSNNEESEDIVEVTEKFQDDEDKMKLRLDMEEISVEDAVSVGSGKFQVVLRSVLAIKKEQSV